MLEIRLAHKLASELITTKSSVSPLTGLQARLYEVRDHGGFVGLAGKDEEAVIGCDHSHGRIRDG